MQSNRAFLSNHWGANEDTGLIRLGTSRQLLDTSSSHTLAQATASGSATAAAGTVHTNATLDPHDFKAWDSNKVYWGEWMDNDHHIAHPGGADVVEYQGAIWVSAYWNVDYTPGSPGSPWSLVSGSPDPVMLQVKPEAPAHLDSGYVSDKAVALFWDPAQVLGAGHVTSYNVYRDGIKIGTTTDTSFTAKGLAAGTNYTFTVDAADTMGTSAKSQAITVHTSGATVASGQYFSPFVDMTLPTTDLVELSHESGLRDFTLAFMQSAGLNSDGTLAQGVIPTINWGGLSMTNLPAGAIIDEVHQVIAEGGDVTISFGGYNGRDPSAVAEMYSHNLQTGPNHYSAAKADAMAIDNLRAEYQSAIDTYGVHHLDFDIEQDFYNGIGYVNPNGAGGLVDDMVANHMRNEALIQLKHDNPNLEITYTVATLPGGMAENYLDMFAQAKTDGVKIDVVNIMAMDYFDGTPGDQMGDAAISAAKAVHAQLLSLGINAKVGITPMIGQNDDVGSDGQNEVFTLNDAAQLETFAHAHTDWVAGIGMWELPRDSASNTDTTGQTPTSTSSGLIQDAFAFSKIFSAISFQATSGADTVVGTSQGETLFGLAGKDTIKGLGGADTIDGGLANDKLIGGSGNDKFVFDTALGTSNVDKITDFSHNHDVIVLENAVFTALGSNTGALNPSFFVANASGTAANTHQHIVYNTQTGALSYDQDGSGSHAAVQFATLINHPTLDAGDFLVS
jgi:chitinase